MCSGAVRRVQCAVGVRPGGNGNAEEEKSAWGEKAEDGCMEGGTNLLFAVTKLQGNFYRERMQASAST